MRPSRLALCVLTAVALAGCGDGDDGPRLGLQQTAPPQDSAAVIRAWADAVREGDIEAANELFAVPATVANGGPKVRLRQRAGVDAFNRSLPCGARVLNTQAASGGYTLATFELVEGSGGTPCEGEAEVSFRIEDGRITEWLREATGPPPGSTEI